MSLALKGHSQLVRMCIRYHFSANLHITTARVRIQKLRYGSFVLRHLSPVYSTLEYECFTLHDKNSLDGETIFSQLIKGLNRKSEMDFVHFPFMSARKSVSPSTKSNRPSWMTGERLRTSEPLYVPVSSHQNRRLIRRSVEVDFRSFTLMEARKGFQLCARVTYTRHN